MTEAATWLLIIVTTIITDPAPHVRGNEKKAGISATAHTAMQMVTEAQCRSAMFLFKGPQRTAICVAPNGELAEHQETK